MARMSPAGILKGLGMMVSRTSLPSAACIAAATVLMCSFVWTASSTADETATRDRRHRQLLEKRQLVYDGIQRDLETVVAWCTEHSLPDAIAQVEEIRQQLLTPTPDAKPSRLVIPPVDTTLSLEEQQWRLQILHHRQQRASELYTLARSALRAKFPSLAFSLVGDAVQLDPDHKYARSVLGQQVFIDSARKDEAGYAGEWVSFFESQMRSGLKAQTFHPSFGWIPVTSVSKYEQGQRPWKGTWISEAKETELRRDFRNAWEIPSEHFLIRTNVSLTAGVELSQQLELFYGWLQQNFAAFFETPQALQDRFEKAGQRSPQRQKPMEVHYFASREEYQKRLEGKVPPNLETNGLYWEPERTSYFFASRDPNDFSTLFHEATHQILDVHTMAARTLAAKEKARKEGQRSSSPWVLCEHSNFWVIEGLACYCESFKVVDGKVSIGRPDYVRFDTARQRMLDPAFYFYLPTRLFFELGKDEFQQHPQVSPLYTQAAGFTHFMMEYEDGLYRDDLIALLAAIYRPDLKAVLDDPSLPKIAGVNCNDFDHQYRTHMQNLADQIAAQKSPE